MIRSTLLAITLAFAAIPAFGEDAKGSVVAKLQPYLADHTLSGAVTLVASKNRVLSFETAGHADVAAKEPMKKDSLFWIASMSKPVSITAFMMLVDEGKVNVDDPAEKYLPEFKGMMVAMETNADHVLLKKPAHPVRVRDLITHTHGLSRAPLDLKGESLSLRNAVRTYSLTPLKWEPGSRYEYSNMGIDAAAAIVEVVSEKHFEDFLDERLLRPLGMKDTTFWPDERQLKRIAKSYKPRKDKTGLDEASLGVFEPSAGNLRRAPGPAGGLFSTATDISIFGRMLLNGGSYGGKRYLSEAAVKQMTSTQTGDLLLAGRDDTGYGFGFMTGRDSQPGAAWMASGTYGHGGAFGTFLWIDPKRELVMVLMIQHASFPGQEKDTIRPTFVKAAVETFGVNSD